MTTDVDLCNRALSQVGAGTITVIDNSTPQGEQCAIWYDVVRRQLLRAAPWGCARKTAVLDVLGRASDTPSAAPYPWLVKYAYPDDCVKMNYILPPPPTLDLSVPQVGDFVVPWCAPSRSNRYIVGYDDTDPEAPARVILSNVDNALGVYVVDLLNPDLMDVGFKQALVAGMAAMFVQPLSGNAGMKTEYIKIAEMAVNAARASDANEAVPTTDHTPDWIAARGVPVMLNMPGWNIGQWQASWDNMSWGM